MTYREHAEFLLKCIETQVLSCNEIEYVISEMKYLWLKFRGGYSRRRRSVRSLRKRLIHAMSDLKQKRKQLLGK